MAIVLNPRELQTFLVAAVRDGLNVLVTGAPGIGKTDIGHQVARVTNAILRVWHPVVSDPTDFKGLPALDLKGKRATFLPFDNLQELVDAKELTLVLIDDIGQSNPSVQASLMQILLAHEINGVKISPFVRFIACTNRRTDRAGVSGILEPVKSRFASIVELEADIDSWSEWAYASGIDPILIAFLRYRPELLSAFAPTADLTNSPMPRTWAHANKLLKLNLPAAIESKVVAGAVGEAAAVEFLTFRRMYQSLVNVDAILLNPDTAAIPGRPNERFAVSVALAARATAQNLKRIAVYAERMFDAGYGEFCSLIFRDAIRRDETLQHTDAFVRVAAGRLGQLFNGVAA